jgi:hypothetical protein
VNQVLQREVVVEGRPVRKVFRALPVAEFNSSQLQTSLQIRGARLIAAVAGLSFSVLVNIAIAQDSPAPKQPLSVRSAKARRVPSPPPVLPSTLIPPPSAILAPPPRPTAEQLPLSAPQVAYADGQLSITAENSTLTEILTAIRLQMGADIDAPPSASREHMVVRLGPGPAREVIASLLSWTDYDYVIQAAEDDPAGVKSVLVTSRPKTGTASAAAGVEMANRSPFSRYGGMTPSPTPTAATEAPADDPVPLAPEKPAETAAEQQVPQPEAKSEPTDQQAASADTQPTIAPNEVRKSDLANTMTAEDTAALEAQAAALAQQEQPPAQDWKSSDPESKGKAMIQQLQQMYQQRIQIQKSMSPSN